MRALIRPAMLVLPLITGIFFPQLSFLGREPYNFIRLALMGMIFLNVLQIKFSDLKPCREHLFTLLCNVFLGTVPFFILKYAMPESIVPAQGAFFTGIAPTAAAAAVIVSLTGGKTGFAVTGFMISNVGISLLLPLLLPLVTENFSWLFVRHVFLNVLTVVGIPLAAAKLTGRFFPGIFRYSPKLKNLSLLLWSLSLLIIASIAREYFDRNAHASAMMIITLLLTALLLCIAGFVAGALVSRREYRSESSQILGQKNTTFAIYLALEYAGNIAVLAPVFYVLFHNIWNSIQLGLARRDQAGGNDENP